MIRLIEVCSYIWWDCREQGFQTLPPLAPTGDNYGVSSIPSFISWGNKHLLWITFIFDRCHHSLPVVTPGTYNHDFEFYIVSIILKNLENNGNGRNWNPHHWLVLGQEVMMKLYHVSIFHIYSSPVQRIHQWPLWLTWINFNPSLDK